MNTRFVPTPDGIEDRMSGEVMYTPPVPPRQNQVLSLLMKAGADLWTAAHDLRDVPVFADIKRIRSDMQFAKTAIDTLYKEYVASERRIAGIEEDHDT